MLRDEFVFGEKEEDMVELRRMVRKTEGDSVQAVVDSVVMQSIANDLSSKFIFGTKESNLEGMISRGWSIENVLESFKVSDDLFICDEAYMRELRVKFQ